MHYLYNVEADNIFGHRMNKHSNIMWRFHVLICCNANAFHQAIKPFCNPGYIFPGTDQFKWLAVFRAFRPDCSSVLIQDHQIRRYRGLSEFGCLCYSLPSGTNLLFRQCLLPDTPTYFLLQAHPICVRFNIQQWMSSLQSFRMLLHIATNLRMKMTANALSRLACEQGTVCLTITHGLRLRYLQQSRGQRFTIPIYFLLGNVPYPTSCSFSDNRNLVIALCRDEQKSGGALQAIVVQGHQGRMNTDPSPKNWA